MLPIIKFGTIVERNKRRAKLFYLPVEDTIKAVRNPLKNGKLYESVAGC